MKKGLLLLATFFVLPPINVFAQNEEEKIDTLLEEISSMEQEIEEKKLEVQRLAHGDPTNDIEYLEMNLNVTSSFYEDERVVTLERIGIDYSNPIPELITIYHVKIIGSDKTSPDSGLEGSLQIETEDSLDWADYSGRDYLIKNDESFMVGDIYDLPTMVAPGWEGYFSRRYEISDPTGEYHLVDYLGGDDFKIAIYGTEKEFGTLVPVDNY